MEQLFIFSFKYNRAVTLVVIDHTFLEELEPGKEKIGCVNICHYFLLVRSL